MSDMRRQDAEVIDFFVSGVRVSFSQRRRRMKGESVSLEVLRTRIADLEKALKSASEADRKRAEAEERLRQSERRYEAMAENLPLGIYRRTCGPEGKLVMVNQALVKMFGYDTAAELLHLPMAKLYYYPDEREAFSRKLFSHREVIREELKMKKRDETAIWVAVTARIICDNDGEPAFFDGIMEDITKRKEAEQVASLRQQQLLQADKMASLGILVSGVAHEINNPAQFIVSHIAPLKKVWEDVVPILDRYAEENGDFLLAGQSYWVRKGRVPDMFKNILEGTDRIKNIVNELRDYAKEHPANLKDLVDINAVLRSALSLLKNLIKKSTTQFFVSYGKDLPPLVGDYQRIEQVIINLIQNACQALEGDESKIAVTTYFDKTEETLVLQVDDTGCGILTENMGRLTDPFFTTKRSAGGTGLGLSISQTIVFEHGGELRFESEAGQGTTARMVLPPVRRPADNTEGIS
jgi:two-component system, NtrC family, sensor kinase